MNEKKREKWGRRDNERIHDVTQKQLWTLGVLVVGWNVWHENMTFLSPLTWLTPCQWQKWTHSSVIMGSFLQTCFCPLFLCNATRSLHQLQSRALQLFLSAWLWTNLRSTWSWAHFTAVLVLSLCWKLSKGGHDPFYSPTLLEDMMVISIFWFNTE